MNFEKTQEQLDTLRNLTWQNGKLVEQIEKLTKMLEEKDDSTLVVEINEAKRVLADAINTKGGNSTPDESFQQLAEDIQTLPYAGISAEGVVQTEEFSFLDFCCNKDFDSIEEINDNKIKVINKDNAFYKGKIKRVSCKVLESISGNSVFSNSYLEEIDMPSLENISGQSTFSLTKLKKVILPNFKLYTGARLFQECNLLEEVIMPNLTTSNDSVMFYNSINLKTIVFGTLINTNSSFFYGGNTKNLRNITIGTQTNIDLYFQNWIATNVIAEGQSGIDELNNNLYNNLLTKLYDHSTDGETRTLRLGWLAHVTQENIDYANSKGWTLTT
jgi:hypothetical protein